MKATARAMAMAKVTVAEMATKNMLRTNGPIKVLEDL